MSHLTRHARKCLALLRRGPLVRAKSGWRFGACRFSEGVVARLIEAGKARLEGNRVVLVEAQP